MINSEMPLFRPSYNNVIENIIYGGIVLICILGLLGNGRTIYLLAYSIKRNFFTTYILNLSIADFGVLITLITAAIFVAVFSLYKETYILFIFTALFFELFFLVYSASQFLLTAISLDRCVAVFFPLWHRCHRPPYLSALVCGIIWTLCFLLSAVHFILHQTRSFGRLPLLYQFTVNLFLCTPLMVVSTTTLLIRVSCNLQHKRRKVITAILLALLFFLLFSFPMDTFYLVELHNNMNHPSLITLWVGSASLNSSINRLLYFLVGRKLSRKDQTRTSLKVALQRVFKDEQDSLEEQQNMEENQL